MAKSKTKAEKLTEEEAAIATVEVQVEPEVEPTAVLPSDVSTGVASVSVVFSLEDADKLLNAYVRPGEGIYVASTGSFYKLAAGQPAQTLIGTATTLSTALKITKLT